jgi:hypothetical protein
MVRTRTIRASALLALAITAACDAGTEPGATPELNAEAVQADFDALQSVLASDDLALLGTLSGRTPFDAAPALETVVSAGTPSLEDGGHAFARALAERLTTTWEERSAEAALGPAISGWHRGTTFVYDPGTDEYTPDLTRTGAPETGMRFVLYELDDQGVPVLDSEVGYVDLVDEGDGSVEDIVLRLTVVHLERTVLDYRTTLDHDATRGALTVVGFLAGEHATLDFDVSVEAERVGEVGMLDVSFAFRVDERDFEVVGTVSGMEEGGHGEGDVQLLVRHRAASIEVEMAGAGGELDGTIEVDGELFATVTGPADDPVITGSTGEPLTWTERLVLLRVIDVVEDVFDFLEDVIEPVGGIVLLGIIL